ncbi:MAG: type II toxin-antitoxin system HicA family toxin [Acidobacteria bacterium]|nr:type II toxin-antitoxin system HicA family toxin [Acidobacteriota bacterium]MCZ6753575.1 type II toxin-antitoxin system HicA family toxin [Acidobacteriota bacterium]
MSKELPALRAKEVIRILGNAGFTPWRQKGSHLTLYRKRDQRVLTVPVHFSKTVPKGDASRNHQASRSLYRRVSQPPLINCGERTLENR